MLRTGSMVTAWIGCVVGLTQGARHALEPDHVTALSTMVASERSALRCMRFAAIWGLGHAAMLVGVSGTLVVLRRAMPDSVANALELAVAAMLLGLGARALQRAVQESRRGPVTRHFHGDRAHVHPMREAHVHVRRWSFATRPFLVGTLHGLAGSGALTALVAASSPSVASGLLFILGYGLGAAVGMAALAGVAGLPLARLGRTRYAAPLLLGAAGTASLALGVIWGWPIVGALLG